MDAFLVSSLIVAASEMGDKTQLLALLLATRFQRPFPIILGILAATLVNHAVSGWLGVWLSSFVQKEWLRWILVASFLAVALWTLIPDKMDDDAGLNLKSSGVFVTTLISFFLAEIGDKTQIATVMLAAKFHPLWAVVAGTTLGMMLANVPAVFIGNVLADRLPLKAIRMGAAILFVALAVVTCIDFKF
jgi:putative Ca2+/H+ antiporter (TMEM165/GDT1 family)